MIAPSLPAACADEPEPLTAGRAPLQSSRRALPRMLPLLALALACGAPLAHAQADAQTGAQPGAQASPDNGALSQQELNEINNQPIAPSQRTRINTPRQPTFELNEADGTQVREYRDRRGQEADIEVRSGAGTQYQMSRPEDSSPRIRDREVNRVPSVRVLQF